MISDSRMTHSNPTWSKPACLAFQGTDCLKWSEWSFWNLYSQDIFTGFIIHGSLPSGYTWNNDGPKLYGLPGEFFFGLICSSKSLWHRPVKYWPLIFALLETLGRLLVAFRVRSTQHGPPALTSPWSHFISPHISFPSQFMDLTTRDLIHSPNTPCSFFLWGLHLWGYEA